MILLFFLYILPLILWSVVGLLWFNAILDSNPRPEAALLAGPFVWLWIFVCLVVCLCEGVTELVDEWALRPVEKAVERHLEEMKA